MPGRIDTEIKGGVGVLVLNRPHALNAFGLKMVQEFSLALQAFRDNPEILIVMIKGAGHKAFCAGGDIRSIYKAVQERDAAITDDLFRREYQLNATIASYPKPYVAILDGVAMGGGVGMSIYGSHRLVTEEALLAMPETGIGFFPDIGASYFLNQAPGALGLFLGLTGYRLSASDALYAGWATHFVPRETLPLFMKELGQLGKKEDLESLITSYAQKAPESLIRRHQAFIDHCFSGKDVEGIFKRLQEADHPIAQEWLSLLQKRSPLSLKVTFELLRRNRGLSLEEALTIELRLSQRLIYQLDFSEGVRAVLLHKDRQPQWNPARLEDVDPVLVDSFFEPLAPQPELFEKKYLCEGK